MPAQLRSGSGRCVPLFGLFPAATLMPNLPRRTGEERGRKAPSRTSIPLVPIAPRPTCNAPALGARQGCPTAPRPAGRVPAPEGPRQGRGRGAGPGRGLRGGVAAPFLPGGSERWAGAFRGADRSEVLEAE